MEGFFFGRRWRLSEKPFLQHPPQKKFHFFGKLHRLFKPLGNGVVQTFWPGRGLMSSTPELQFNFAHG